VSKNILNLRGKREYIAEATRLVTVSANMKFSLMTTIDISNSNSLMPFSLSSFKNTYAL
jgi:hypothetical protein